MAAATLFVTASWSAESREQATITVEALTTTAAQPDSVTATTANFMNMRINQSATARLRYLQQKERELTSQLETARAALGTSVEGATARTLEQYNIRQDSICLDLSSQLTDVRLEISELTGKK